MLPSNLFHKHKISLTALVIFIIALAIRMPSLGLFLTADEFLWIDRSRNFLGGVISNEFTCLLPDGDKTNAVPGHGMACTLRTGHPGVITMWTGAAAIYGQWLIRQADDERSLIEFVEQMPTNPVEAKDIGPMRLPSVVLTSFFVAVFFILFSQLFHTRIAALAGLLVALNPFHIALSRVIHHDALSTNFLLTSALSLIIYLGVKQQRKWLVLSAIMAGLAMLTKLTGFFMIPYFGLLGLLSLGSVWARKASQLKNAFVRLIVDGLLWFGLTLVTYGLLWPALWVIPNRVFNTLFSIGTKYATTPHAKGVFFLGVPQGDPGPLFYPIVWFFRSPAWSMIGVAIALILFLIALWQRHSNQLGRLRQWVDRLSPRGFQDQTGLLLWAGLFICFFALTLMVGVDKKLDRYLLPIYPMLDLIAAVGLLTLIRSPLMQGFLTSIIIIVNLALIYFNAPYYFTYYNPLVGGMQRAVQTITVGWGEGMNLAADYLNAKPNAANLQVSSWYGSTFAPYFSGTTIPYSDQKGKALGGDYVVFYINQRQRKFPDQEIWYYLEKNHQLEKTISLGGADYAWIFTGSGINHYVEDQRYKGIAELLGWDWRGDLSPDTDPIPAGASIPFSLYWEYLGKSPEETFFIRLIGPDGNNWAEALTQPTAEYADTTLWREGQIIKEEGIFSVPAETPPGTYQLQIGFYTQAPAVTGGELLFPTEIAPLDQPLQTLKIRPAQQEADNSTGLDLLELKLLSASYGEPIQPETGLDLTVTWLLPQATTHNYQASFSLLDEGGIARWQWTKPRALIPFLPTSEWPLNRPLLSQWNLPLTPQTPGGNYFLQTLLTDQQGNTAKTGLKLITLPGRSRNFIEIEPDISIDATFASAIQVSGLDLSDDKLIPNHPLYVNLYWQAAALLDDDYTTFLQLLGPSGDVIAQQDKVPLNGGAPTSTWTPGEVLTDSFVLPLPNTLPNGEYRLITGFYQFETGERLPLTQGGSDNFIEVWSWEQ